MMMVAQKRFELLSRAPEAPMLDHYTTGLQKIDREKQCLHLLTLSLRLATLWVCLSRNNKSNSATDTHYQHRDN